MDYIELNQQRQYQTITSSTGIDFVTNTINSNTVKSSLDDVYGQIHIIKRNIDLGFISQTYETTIEVWNAMSSSKVISSISIDKAGVSILYNNSDVVLPFQIPSNTSRVFNLVVSNQGAFNIDTTYTFNFVTGETATGIVNGKRAFLFDFDHNWIGQFVESYSYVTEINKSITSNEQRFSFSYLPKYSCSYMYKLNKEDKQKFAAIIYNNVDVVYSLPLYLYALRASQEVQAGSDTLYFYNLKDSIFQTGMTLMLKNKLYQTLEVVSIESVDVVNNKIKLQEPLLNVIRENTQAVPVISARIQDNPSESRLTTHISDFSLTFIKEQDEINMLHANNDSIIINKIDNINYLELTPNQDLTVNVEYNPNDVTLTNNNSIVEHFKYQEYSEVALSFNYKMYKREQFSYLKKIFEQQEGRYQDLYLMNFSNDVKIIKNIVATDTQITIKNINAANMYANKGIKYLNIRVGTAFKRVKILDIVTVNSEEESIIISEPFGINLDHTYINYSAFLYLGRLNSDDLIIRYTTDLVADTSINFLKNVDV